MATATPSPLPNASATIRGAVSLLDQVMGDGIKTFPSAIGLISDPTAPVAPLGEIRFRNNANTPEVSSNGGAYAPLGVGGGGVWGSITGTLANQTDLVTALGLRAALAGATFTGEVSCPYARFVPGSAPGTPTEGQVYYDSVSYTLKYRNNVDWVDVGAGSVADASATVAGKVNLVAQVLGAGPKTITDGLITPIVSNTNGTGASDLVVQIGTSVADGSVNSSAKLLSLRTGIGGTPVEKLFVLKSGSLTSASCLAMLSDPSAPVSASGGVALRALTGVAEISTNGGAYTPITALLTTYTPQALTSSGGHIAIDMSAGQNFYHTTSESTVLDAPTGLLAGMSGVIGFTQGAVVRTLTFNSFWKFSAGIVPTLTPTVGAKDTLVYYVNQGATFATCRLIGNVS